MIKSEHLDKDDFMYSDEVEINPTLVKYSFSLSDKFLEKYKNKKVKWDVLGYTTYKRSYARPKPDGKYEEWWETIQRVVETVYTIQKWYVNEGTGSVWNEWKAQKSAQEMYDRMFNFKFLPAGRGLFGMNKELLAKKGSSLLFNCSAVSTENIDYDFAMPFVWSMMMSFLGVGVGFDTRGAAKERKLLEPKLTDKLFVVKDSKEGWVEALEVLLRAYSQKGKLLPKDFDFSQIRPKGSPIKTFGGIAPGSGPLEKLIERVRGYLDDYVSNDKSVDSTLIVDIMTSIGEAVVSGGVRRSAMLALGDIKDKEFLNLKNYKENANEIGDKPRWASNNSIIAKPGDDYSKIIEGIIQNGEPGLIFIDNAREYSRTKDPKDYKDMGVDLVNPCVTGDTEVVLANGDSVKIKDLANKGDPIEVVCVDDDLKITTRTMRNPRCTGEKEVFEIRLRGSMIPIKATGNHKFMSPNGEYIQVKDMIPGETQLIWKDTTIYTRRVYQGGDLDKALKNYYTKTVVSIKSVGVEKVYNGTVDDFHNYIVLPERIMHSHPDGIRDISMVEFISKFGLVSKNCGEIGLESYGLCNLVEIFLPHNDDLDDFKKTIKYAYLYGKTVTLLKTHSPVTNGVIMNTRRIGIGVSGITQAIDKFGYRNLMNILDQGYDEIEVYDKKYSSWFGIPLSIKKTTTKPSGSVSLLAGVTPGIHFPHSKYYWRTIRIQKSSPILQKLVEAGYKVEDALSDPEYTSVVYFPIKEEYYTKSKEQVSVWEQLALVNDIQRYWSDNLVSVTLTFNPETEGKDIQRAIEMYEDKLKGMSFLPLSNHGYKQAPYQEINEEEYNKAIENIKSVSFKTIRWDKTVENREKTFCDSDKCQLDLSQIGNTDHSFSLKKDKEE